MDGLITHALAFIAGGALFCALAWGRFRRRGPEEASERKRDGTPPPAIENPVRSGLVPEDSVRRQVVPPLRTRDEVKGGVDLRSVKERIAAIEEALSLVESGASKFATDLIGGQYGKSGLYCKAQAARLVRVVKAARILLQDEDLAFESAALSRVVLEIAFSAAYVAFERGKLLPVGERDNRASRLEADAAQSAYVLLAKRRALGMSVMDDRLELAARALEVGRQSHGGGKNKRRVAIGVEERATAAGAQWAELYDLWYRYLSLGAHASIQAGHGALAPSLSQDRDMTLFILVGSTLSCLDALAVGLGRTTDDGLTQQVYGLLRPRLADDPEQPPDAGA